VLGSPVDEHAQRPEGDGESVGCRWPARKAVSRVFAVGKRLGS